MRAYNEKNPDKPLGLKLRVWGGFEAPDWAKALGGAPIATMYNGKPRSVGLFWSPPIGASGPVSSSKWPRASIGSR